MKKELTRWLPDTTDPHGYDKTYTPLVAGKEEFHIFSSASSANAWKRKHMHQEIPNALMKTGCYFLLLSKCDM